MTTCRGFPGTRQLFPRYQQQSFGTSLQSHIWMESVEVDTPDFKSATGFQVWRLPASNLFCGRKIGLWYSLEAADLWGWFLQSVLKLQRKCVGRGRRGVVVLRGLARIFLLGGGWLKCSCCRDLKARNSFSEGAGSGFSGLAEENSPERVLFLVDILPVKRARHFFCSTVEGEGRRSVRNCSRSQFLVNWVEGGWSKKFWRFSLLNYYIKFACIFTLLLLLKTLFLLFL